MSAQNAQKPLDDVMLAMDVVDTLRRNSRVVEQELGADDQEKKLLDRLKNIYGQQGIDVPDHILREGVKALREDRFTYTPTPTSFSRMIAKIYIKRTQWARPVITVFIAIILCFTLYVTFYTIPEQRAATMAQRDLQTLPADFERLITRIENLTDDTTIEENARNTHADGRAALAVQDIDTARAHRDALQNLQEKLIRTYDLRIVSGQDQTSGVWRVPDDNPYMRNYYLIVEPISSGKPITIDIVNEENNKTSRAQKFGIRVPQSTFSAVLQDKQDDGIIQNNIVGTKHRGTLGIEYTIPVLGGIITEW